MTTKTEDKSGIYLPIMKPCEISRMLMPEEIYKLVMAKERDSRVRIEDIVKIMDMLSQKYLSDNETIKAFSNRIIDDYFVKIKQNEY